MSERQGLTSIALAIGLGAVVVVPLACAGQKGATEQQLAAARQKSGEGSTLYKEHCAECHGQRGEGQPGVPHVMGPSALPVKVKQKAPDSSQMNDPAMRDRIQRTAVPGGGQEMRIRFNTAADIFKYMTEDHPGLSNPVSDDQMWQVLTFMLDAHGLKVPPGGLTADNAASVKNER